MTATGDQLVVTVNGRDVGLASLLAKLEQQLDKTASKATKAEQTIESGLTRAQQRAAAQSLSLAQAQARGEAAAGNYAAAVQRLNAALQNAEVVNIRQGIAVNNQIASYQRAAQAAEQAATAQAQQASRLEQLINVAGVAGVALALPQAIDGTVALIQQGAAAQQVATRFNSLAQASGTTGDELLRVMRAASGGEISNLNLQLAANRANLLGVADSADELATLLQIAADRAQLMGITTTQAFNDLVTGLGRGSPLILDNLGITVNLTEANARYAEQLGKTAAQLTDAEKKQALVNAVLEQGRATIEATGGAAETNAGKIARLTATLENLANVAGGALADAVLPTIDVVSGLANAFDGSSASILRYVDAANTYLNANATVAQANRDAAQAVLAGRDSVTAFTDAILSGASIADAYAAALRAVAAEGANIKGGMDLAIAGVEGLKGAMSTFSFDIARNGIGTAAGGGVSGLLGTLTGSSSTGGRKPGARSVDVQAATIRAAASRGRGSSGTPNVIQAQTDYQNEAQQLALEHQQKLTQIERDGATKRAEAENSFRLSQLQGRAGFYASLANIDDNALRQELSAKYEQAAQEAADIAKTQGADAAQAYLEASRQAVENEAQLREQIAQADAAGDTGKAEYFRGLLKLQQDADAEQLRQIRENGSAIAQQQAAQYAAEEAAYAEHLDRMAQTYVQKTGQLPGFAGTIAAPPVTGGTPAAITAPPAGAATPQSAATVVTDPGAYAALNAAADRLNATLTDVAGRVDTVAARVSDVERAVGSLRGRLMSGG